MEPNTRSASFTSASCTNKNNDSVCMAVGSYCTDKFCSHRFPLLAVTTDGGQTWRYPSSIFKNLNSRIDPNLTQAFFSDVNCSSPKIMDVNPSSTNEMSFCIASGQYSTASNTFPLVAYSPNSGANWIYPKYIFQNLTTTVNPDFVSGHF